jgi:hypothetical protein
MLNFLNSIPLTIEDITWRSMVAYSCNHCLQKTTEFSELNMVTVSRLRSELCDSARRQQNGKR